MWYNIFMSLTRALIFDSYLDEISNWWSVVASIMNFVTIFVLVASTKRQGSNYWELIHYEKGKTTGKQIMTMVITILVVGMAGALLSISSKVLPYLRRFFSFSSLSSSVA